MRWGVIVLVTGFGLGCDTLSPLESPGGTGCTTDADCKGMRVCEFAAGAQFGACVDPLDGGTGPLDGGLDGGGTQDGGLPDGGRTDGGGDIGLGAPCQSARDCAEAGMVCIEQFPGGYCALPDCIQCPGACVVGLQGDEFCVQACSGDDECRAGYACTDFLGAFACLPSFGGGSSPVGGECTTSADCQGRPSFCMEDWPDGYCIHTDCDDCPAGSTCVRNINFAACLADCRLQTDCRTGYLCQTFRDATVCIGR